VSPVKLRSNPNRKFVTRWWVEYVSGSYLVQKLQRLRAGMPTADSADLGPDFQKILGKT